jgi:hypothetical protein
VYVAVGTAIDLNMDMKKNIAIKQTKFSSGEEYGLSVIVYKLDRTARTKQLRQDRTVGKKQPGQDSQDRTAVTGQPRQDNRDTADITRQEKQDTMDRTARTGQDHSSHSPSINSSIYPSIYRPLYWTMSDDQTKI